MARFLTLVLSGPAILALIACNQGPVAEANREAEAVEAMTNDLRNDAEKAARSIDSQKVVRSGTGEAHAKPNIKSMAAKANPVSD